MTGQYRRRGKGMGQLGWIHPPPQLLKTKTKLIPRTSKINILFLNDEATLNPNTWCGKWHRTNYNMRRKDSFWEWPGPFSAFNPLRVPSKGRVQTSFNKQTNVKKAFLRNPDEGLQVILSNMRKWSPTSKVGGILIQVDAYHPLWMEKVVYHPYCYQARGERLGPKCGESSVAQLDCRCI